MLGKGERMALWSWCQGIEVKYSSRVTRNTNFAEPLVLEFKTILHAHLCRHFSVHMTTNDSFDALSWKLS